MAFTEDLDVFFNTDGFGVDVSTSTASGVGIFDMPSEVIADGVILTTDYRLLVKTSDFPSLLRGTSMTVDGLGYSVREAMLMDDGKITQVMLMKD